MENVLLSVRHLKKAFGDHMIFEDFDLDVRKGEVVVVIGPSGCGKSTLLRCLNGLEPIQGGEILLDGEPVLRESKSITRIRQKIGMDAFTHTLACARQMLFSSLTAAAAGCWVDSTMQTFRSGMFSRMVLWGNSS